MAEKFSLKWNDFNSNVSKSFSLFRNEEFLQDVTLVTDDNHQVSAQKFVLSASSEYFKNIFLNNKHPHPLLCLGGVNSEDLRNILDFIYNGEVNIYQDCLDRFLEVAQRFKIEGLLGNQNQIDDLEDPQESKEIKVSEHGVNNSSKCNSSSEDKTETKIELNFQNIVAMNSGDYIEIDEKISENMQKNEDGKYSCQFCDRVMSHKTRMKEHVETHMDNLSFPCNNCGKTFRSRHSLKVHISSVCKIKYIH